MSTLAIIIVGFFSGIAFIIGAYFIMGAIIDWKWKRDFAKKPPRPMRMSPDCWWWLPQ